MTDWLQELMILLPSGSNYYLLLFLVAFAESIAVVGLIVPGSTLIVLAGFLVVAGKGTFTGLFLVATLGALLGDLFSFWLGGHYGSRILRMRIFLRRRAVIRYAQKFFISHGGKSLFFARFLGPIRGITPFIAGVSGFRARTASFHIVISALLWGVTYPGLGYLGGSSLQQVQSLGARFGLGILVLLLIVVVHYQVKKLFNPPTPPKKSRKKKPPENGRPDKSQ